MITELIQKILADIRAAMPDIGNVQYFSRFADVAQIAEKPAILLTMDELQPADGETGTQALPVTVVFSAIVAIDATEAGAALTALSIGERLIASLIHPANAWSTPGVSPCELTAAQHVDLSTGNGANAWSAASSLELFRVQWTNIVVIG